MWHLTLSLLFLTIVTGKVVPNISDNGRFFGKIYTTTLIENKVITSLVPSSCVLVDPTLPPCRNVRYLHFPEFPSFNKVNTTESNLKSTLMGWGEYLGLYPPTVTVIQTNIQVSTVQNPSVVVTYAIKGCKPLKLPSELDNCPLDDSSSMPIEEVLETSTVQLPIIPTETLLPTKTMIVGSSSILQEEFPLGEGVNSLEPSADPGIQENINVKPTAPLCFFLEISREEIYSSALKSFETSS